VRSAKVIVRAGVSAALVAITAAGCSGFGGPKSQQAAAAPPPDPNAYPANYSNQIARFLATQLTDRADFHGALIAPPVLKPVGASQHYVVCLQFDGHSQIKNKVAIFLAGEITQFIDSTPEQCAGAAYQPYKDLEGALPSTNG
jgi:hypothetical protein